ncbi:MAG: transglutaminase-like domain-containing protein [Candidatus Woesearchaeota archaeon]
MKTKLLFLFLIFLLPTVAFSYIQAQELIIEQTIRGGVQSQSDISHLQARLTYVPFDTFSQQLLQERYYPDTATRLEQEILFEWPGLVNYVNYEYQYTIHTKNRYAPVTSKVTYPLQVTPELLEYVEFTHLMDSNMEIIEKAQELAQGSDDVFVIASTIAHWVTQNIEYDLNTLTVEASNPATWVFENRFGVCDELSVLFVSMMRSLNIPARVVTGISYTTSDLFDQPWNAHAWAQVYMGEYGWVPFDLTYRQFGYVDATHMQISESYEGDQTAVQFQYRSLDSQVSLDISPLEFQTRVLNQSDDVSLSLIAEIDVARESVGFGSYQRILATITNTQNHYIAAFIDLSTPEAVEGEKKQFVILEPHQTIKRSFLVTTPMNLDSQYIYTFPVALYTQGIELARTNFTSTHQSAVYQPSDIPFVESQTSSAPFSCDTQSTTHYSNETIFFLCENTEDVQIELCFIEQCASILPGEKETFEATFERPGIYDRLIEYESQSFALTFVVRDRARLQISDLTYPRTVEKNDSPVISFTLEKTSVSNPQHARVTLTRKQPQVWSLPLITQDQDFVYELSHRLLKPGLNEFTLALEYHDGERRQVEIQTIEIEFVGLSFFERMWLYLRDLLL